MSELFQLLVPDRNKTTDSLLGQHDLAIQLNSREDQRRSKYPGFIRPKMITSMAAIAIAAREAVWE